MFKKIYVVALLFVFQVTASRTLYKVDGIGINYEEKIICNISEQRRGWPVLVKKYGASILSGAIIGSLCGLSCAYIEKLLKLGYSRLIVWLVFRAIRIGITDNLVIDAQGYGADHSRVTIYSSAWIADWLSYLLCCYRN